MGIATLSDPSSSRLCGVGSIQYCYNTLIFLKPSNHVNDRSLSRSMPKSFSLLVLSSKEICCRLRRIVSAVRADVESFRGDG